MPTLCATRIQRNTSRRELSSYTQKSGARFWNFVKGFLFVVVCIFFFFSRECYPRRRGLSVNALDARNAARGRQLVREFIRFAPRSNICGKFSETFHFDFAAS